jgi:hypothetical protein
VRRLLSTVAVAALGGLLGNLVRQLAGRRRAGGSGDAELVVGLPVGVVGAATLLGLVAGRRTAFVSAGVLGAVLGQEPDRRIPGLARLHERADAAAADASGAAAG